MPWTDDFVWVPDVTPISAGNFNKMNAGIREAHAAVKPTVVVAVSTGNVSLPNWNDSYIAGVPLALNDLVALVAQTNPAENGVYRLTAVDHGSFTSSYERAPGWTTAADFHVGRRIVSVLAALPGSADEWTVQRAPATLGIDAVAIGSTNGGGAQGVAGPWRTTAPGALDGTAFSVKATGTYLFSVSSTAFRPTAAGVTSLAFYIGTVQRGSTNNYFNQTGIHAVMPTIVAAVFLTAGTYRWSLVITNGSSDGNDVANMAYARI